MLQPAFSDCLFLDFLSHLQDLRVAALIDVGECQVGEALMVSMVLVTVDEGVDLPFQVAGQEVVFEEHAVFHGVMSAFDFALGLRMVWRTVHVFHTFGFEVFGQICLNVG